jgi:ATP-binding cassette subfamily C (CFTR/MRP) protein 1
MIILRTAMEAPLSFFASTDTGTTLNRFSQDMNLVDIEMPPGVLEVGAQVVIVTVQAVLMCLSARYLAACLPFVLLVMYVLQKFYLRTSRQLRLLYLEAKAPLFSHFVETLEGLVTIRVFGWSKDFEQVNADLLEASQKPFHLLFCVQSWLALVLDFTVAGLMIVLMILFVKLRGTIDPGFAGIALVNMSGFSTSLTLLIKAWTTLETSMGAISRIKSFAAQTPSENQSGEDQMLPPAWPQHGSIEFTALSASYKPEVPVLKDITLRILPGQRVGICGPSGSGKSSIIATLFRMLEISSGKICIDGYDISRIDRGDLRMHINVIPQDAFLFKGTVRENLDPFNRYHDEGRKRALRKVQLWAALESRKGLDTPADAVVFLHGQRQLFCLARAILHPSKIVVLDECTSSVDLVTEHLMQRVIREEFKHCTIIAVAHRLDTIMGFDVIATDKAGELVEFDTPAALMARDSAFKRLYESR